MAAMLAGTTLAYAEEPGSGGGSLLELPAQAPAPSPAAAPATKILIPPPSASGIAPNSAPVAMPPPALSATSSAPAGAASPASSGVSPAPSPTPAVAPSAEAQAPVQPVKAPGVTPPNAASAATPGKPAPSSAIDSKYPDLLLAPMHPGMMSLMFSKSDMDVIVSFADLYDRGAMSDKKTEATPTGEKDDFMALLQSIKSQEPIIDSASPVPVLLPNVYLGSIVYYSPTQWSVWINGKKLPYSRNSPEGEFYVGYISREEIELVWKPSSLLDTPTLWKSLTDNGKKTLLNVRVDESKGKIILRMRPNQTFLSRSLAIREGLIKS